MMKYLLITFLLALCHGSHAAAPVNKEACLKSLQEFMKNGAMDYKVHCIYPDGSTLNIAGHTVIKNDLFYDSSNVRTMLINKTWFINADHANANIALVDFRTLSKKAIQNINANRTTYLLTDEYFQKNATISVLKEDPSFLWLSVKLRDTRIVERLVIQFSKKDLKPVLYEAVMNVPADRSVENGLTAKVTLKVSNLVSNPDEGIFNHTRIIDTHNKELAVKKFRNYTKTLYTDKKR